MTPWNNIIKRLFNWLRKGHFIRKAVIRRYCASSAVRKIQLAPGDLPTTKQGWLTADIFTGDIYFNGTKQLPFTDGVIDNYFSEHFLEHLTYQDAINLLSEMMRTLKHGGTIRMSVPDVEKIVVLYQNRKSLFFERFCQLLLKLTPKAHAKWLAGRNRLLPAEYLNVSFYGFDHLAVWDFELFKEVCKALGYVDLKKFEPGESDKDVFTNIERHTEIDPDNPLAVSSFEATKPLKPVSPQGMLKESIRAFLR